MVSVRSYISLFLGVSTSLFGMNGSFQIERLDEQAIELQKADFARAQEKNLVVRKCAKAGIYILGTAAALGGIYALWKGGNVRQIPVAEPSVGVGTLEELQKELQKRIENLEHQFQKPAFGTMAWAKAIAWNFFFDPIITINMVELVAKLGYKFVSKLFYSPTLGWYIQERTMLGRFLYKSGENDTLRLTLAHGVIAEELDHNAMALDKAAESAEPFDSAYHKDRIIANFNRIVKNMTGLIGFLQYKADDAASNKQLRLEASDRARYLFNYTNKFCVSLESALSMVESAQSDKKQLVAPLIKGFFVQLEQVLVSFIHIENECCQQV